MPLTAEWFYGGLTTPEYFTRLKTNKEAIPKVYETVEVPTNAKAFFDRPPQPLRLAVFTEDWCGDALTSTPSILKLADTCTGIEARTFERDKNLALANSFLPDHRHGTLPVFVVLDSDMHEIARFIETAEELKPAVGKMMDDLKARLLHPDERDKPMPELSPESRAAFGSARAAYRVAHAPDWGQVVIGAFLACVTQGLALPPAERPAIGGTQWPAPHAH